MIKPLIVSAPFGNWIDSRSAMSTLGTYTVKNRAGFLRWWTIWRILYTLRYRPSVGGWTNKLGLPNPGVQHLFKRLGQEQVRERAPNTEAPRWAKERIVSIHGFDMNEWRSLLSYDTMKWYGAVELNLGCPNIGHSKQDGALFDLALSLHSPDRLIVKLPPVSYMGLFEAACRAGVTTFHATNTLPVPAGGLSGKALMRVSLDVVKRLRDAEPSINIIGGGGITSPQDVFDYRRAGASSVAVGSALLSPSRWLRSSREKFLCSLHVAATMDVKL